MQIGQATVTEPITVSTDIGMHLSGCIACIPYSARQTKGETRINSHLFVLGKSLLLFRFAWLLLEILRVVAIG
jgi:hypothetical protein